MRDEDALLRTMSLPDLLRAAAVDLAFSCAPAVLVSAVWIASEKLDARPAPEGATRLSASPRGRRPPVGRVRAGKKV